MITRVMENKRELDTKFKPDVDMGKSHSQNNINLNQNFSKHTNQSNKNQTCCALSKAP